MGASWFGLGASELLLCRLGYIGSYRCSYIGLKKSVHEFSLTTRFNSNCTVVSHNISVSINSKLPLYTLGATLKYRCHILHSRNQKQRTHHTHPRHHARRGRCCAAAFPIPGHVVHLGGHREHGPVEVAVIVVIHQKEVRRPVPHS